MLVDFSTQVVTDLNSHEALIALLDGNSVAALISEEEDGDSFINYFIKYNGSVSKEPGVSDYQVVVESWSDTYDKSIEMADEVQNAIAASENHYTYLSADSEPFYSEGKTRVVTKQIFNIKQ